MKILLVNKFLYPRGGDAVSTIKTGELLTKHGHTVHYWGMAHPDNPPYPFERLFVSHIDFEKIHSPQENIRILMRILYSNEAKNKIGRVLDIFKPDIVHLNNFAHQISPSIIDAIYERKIPIVMTPRDFKLVCPVYSLFSHGRPCEQCAHGRYYHCIVRKCTKNSRFKSGINAIEMYLHHDVMRIYEKINLFIAPSRFMQNKMQNLGFRGRIVHLPNFIDSEVFYPQNIPQDQNSIVYTGRLSPEKGLFTLLEAMQGVNATLAIIGDGPLGTELKKRIIAFGLQDRVKLSGYGNVDTIIKATSSAMWSICPSECYENNPRTIIESFALGIPVIGARIGGIPELIDEGRTGFAFTPGNALDLEEKINRALSDPHVSETMGVQARSFVLEKCSPSVHYPKLMELYESVL